MYRKAEPLYGAPRGNRVMKAKRTTGESAQRILIRHVTLEHCHVAGCKNPVCVTKHPDAMTRIRYCFDHLTTGSQVRKRSISDLLAMPTRNGG